MSTKLGRYCEGILEAAWIASVIAIPLFFNIYSSRIFEPDKITILRTIAILVLAAWVVKLIESGGWSWEKIPYKGSFLRTKKEIPILLPVLILVAVYLIATIFSVTPRISLGGSYQRLQGTYTTLSYIVIFASVVGNLRKRSQVDRLISVLILTSLPVGLYGILQKYEIDPVPWGGNVANRIASNMGNSIFVAAYLIMIVPMTIGRIIDAFRKILNEDEKLGPNVVRATIYIFIAAVELIAIYMSGSRGPFLGLLAGLFFMFILLSVYWQKRWLTITTIGAAGFLGIFLVLLNIPNGPLEFIRQAPGVGRFGQVLDLDQRTSQVRMFIWKGASELVFPHDPLVFPDGTMDKLNFLRPIIGYGPESMYVAYNQFYPAELGRLEKRNASPDRSHNETWDSLVTTGFIGLLAYLFLFCTIFYYGLKWVGLIRTKNHRNLFIILMIAGSVIGGIVSFLWQGISFIGVGIPYGILLGLIGYITWIALSSSEVYRIDDFKKPHILILIMLLGAIVAHFAEINFGIAIVATRTHFWLYTGLLLVVGYVFPLSEGTAGSEIKTFEKDNNEEVITSRSQQKSKKTRKRRSQSSTPILGRQPAWQRNAIISAFIVSLIMITIGYDFISNPNNTTSLAKIISNSLTRLPNKGDAISFGVLALILTTWLSAAAILTSEQKEAVDNQIWIKSFFIVLGVSILIVLTYWIWHALTLSVLSQFKATNQFEVLEQIDRIGGILTRYYIFLFLLLFIMAFFLPEEWTSKLGYSSIGVIAAPVLLILIIFMASWTNLRVIHSDIAFKMAEPFANTDQWPVATYIYKKALDLTPKEDHYYLFLGKSYLEQAKTVEGDDEQNSLIQQAESDLKVAQKINPLNTDHTANLGRLYSWWAGREKTADGRIEKATIASEYYNTAVHLSPNNPNLWNEWAILYLDIFQDATEGLNKLSHSLELDDKYSWTHSILGDYYLRLARATQDENDKQGYYDKSIEHYQLSIDVATNRETDAKVSYIVALGNIYIELANNSQTDKGGYIRSAIKAYLLAIETGPRKNDLWKIEETLSRLYAQLGEKSNALNHASAALEAAPNNQKEKLQNLIAQIQSLP